MREDSPALLRIVVSMTLPLLGGPIGKTPLTPEGLGNPAILSLEKGALDSLLMPMTGAQVNEDAKVEASKARQLAEREQDIANAMKMKARGWS